MLLRCCLKQHQHNQTVLSRQDIFEHPYSSIAKLFDLYSGNIVEVLDVKKAHIPVSLISGGGGTIEKIY